MTSTKRPVRIVLLHATPVAIAPIEAAFAALWPEADTVNLLDDSLSADRAREADLTQDMIARFVSFGRYGHSLGADGVLVTCSAFGPAIDALAATLPIPVLKPNEAMFREAIPKGARIGMLATFGPAVDTMTEEFEEQISREGRAATLTTILVPRAMDALRAGDVDEHNRLVAGAAPELAHCDAVMLAHFSTSRAAAAVRAAVDIPVLTAPETAVRLMRAEVEERRR